MKEHIKLFRSVAEADNHKIDNPFITTIISPTGLINISCTDGDYLVAEGDTIAMIHRIPKPANNEICYRTALSEAVEPNANTLLGENDTVLHIVSNNFEPAWRGYRMVLDGDLVKVGSNAFYKTCQFTGIRLPDSLERICSRGFRQCSDQWMTLEFGSGIKYIDDQAFHADMIKNLVFPSSLLEVSSAFWYAGISHDDDIFRIPAGISFANGPFANAWAFNTIIFEEGRTSLSRMFNGIQASDVRNVILPSTLLTMDDHTFGNCSQLTHIDLPDGLTTIGEGVFRGSGLTSITIPDSVVNLGVNALSECINLTSVNLGAGITSIPDYCFYGDESLPSITLPDGITSIGKSAFYKCKKLPTIDLGTKITSIPIWCFGYCDGLSSITIPNSVTNIDEYAFYNCINLSSIDFGAGVSSIGKGAFYNCVGLASITIPNSVTVIGYGSFQNCKNLTTANLGTGVTTIGNGAFSKSGLTSITIPDSVTSIGNSAFNKSGLTSITIQASVTSIGSYIVAGCNMQSISVASGNPTYDSRDNCNAIIETSTNKLIVGNIDITVIPDTVTTIGYASMAMSRMPTTKNSVDIPASVTSIEKWAFELIPTLTTVYCRATNPPTLDALTFEGSDNIAHIYVPSESVEAYKTATNWSTFANIIEAIPVE